MKHQLSEEDSSEQQDIPTIPHAEPIAGTGSLEAALAEGESPIKRFLKVLGPGLITGASDDDPSGIGTYTSAGASLGFATLWTALLTFPLMAVVQYTCAKVGMVSGRGLAGVLKRHYAPWVVYPAVIGLLLANTINAGADIGAIAAAINLLVPIPAIVFIVPISLLILALQIWGSYRLIARVFRLLTLMLLAYIGSAFFSHPDALAVLKGTFIPTLRWDNTFIATLGAILGTTISPYLFFWQSNQEVEEEISKGRTSLRQRKGADAIPLTPCNTAATLTSHQGFSNRGGKRSSARCGDPKVEERCGCLVKKGLGEAVDGDTSSSPRSHGARIFGCVQWMSCRSALEAISQKYMHQICTNLVHIFFGGG